MAPTGRTAALEEKKRRLDALRARRSGRSNASTSTASSSLSSSAVMASKTGNLDDYIDGLLNSPPPVVVPSPSDVPASASASSNNTNDGSGVGDGGTISRNNSGVGMELDGSEGRKTEDRERGSSNPSNMNTDSSADGNGNGNNDDGNSPQVATKKVETFAMSTQTEDDDFPSDASNSSTEKDEEDNEPNNDSEQDDNENQQSEDDDGPSSSSSILPEAKLLSPEQVNEAVTRTQFSTFFTSASKKVERLLGAEILSDLLVDDTTYSKNRGTNEDDNDNNDASNHNDRRKHALVSAQVSFSFPRWTQGRDITSLDWSPHHRGGELMLASYHMPSSPNTNTNTNTSEATNNTNNNNGSTAVPSLSPNPTPASTLQPRSKSEMTHADGLCILWNLTMPSRPEHIFTCGSPVLQAKFHPTEPNLVIGACHSGQVVVWDVRSGRLPVQRSSLNIFGSGVGNGTGGKNDVTGGHVHPVVGMELLDGGSALVTASSDGKVNFWSPSNLRDPAETILLPGNISSIAIAPESQSILLGDESGSMHTIISSSSTGGRSHNIRRTTRTLNDDDIAADATTGGGSGDTGGADQLKPATGSSRHFGMVTGLSTKRTSMLPKSGSGAGGAGGVSLSRGFVRGANGLALSCGVDWTTKLWAPAYSDKPLMNLLSHSYDYMCDVQWSPVHPSIFATASSDGTLGIWNLASSLDEPITGADGVTVDGGGAGDSSHGLNKIKWSQDGRRIVAASWDTLHVFGMSEDVWKPKGDEEGRMMNNLKGRGFLFEG